MEALSEWYIANKLSLNLDIGKSSFILFHSKNNRTALAFPDKILFGNKCLHRTTSTKYIGVTIDERLDWNEHINITCSKLVRLFGVFFTSFGAS